ncbi:hypothetical protein Tco_0475124 [Tanacetum coccineum]
MSMILGPHKQIIQRSGFASEPPTVGCSLVNIPPNLNSVHGMSSSSRIKVEEVFDIYNRPVTGETYASETRNNRLIDPNMVGSFFDQQLPKGPPQGNPHTLTPATDARKYHNEASGLEHTCVACLAFELNGWLQVGMASGMMSVKRSRFSKTTCATCWLVHSWCYVEEECYLVDPASSHMLVSKIKPCMFKKLVVGLWVGSAGPPYGVHRFTRPFCRRCAPGLNWLGRASGAVTLKKLECSKQAYALRTTAKAFAKDVFINQERKLGARRRSDTVLVSTINDADQGSADVAYRTPLAPYEKSKFLGSGGSMVARLKLKGIDGRAPPGVEPAA